MHVKFVNGREPVSAQCLRFADAAEVHGAKNNERHVCGRPQVVSGPCLVSTQCPGSLPCLVNAQCSRPAFDPGRVILITCLPLRRVDANETNGI